MSIDTSDYILSKVHDCLENQPTTSTVKKQKKNIVSRSQTLLETN